MPIHLGLATVLHLALAAPPAAPPDPPASTPTSTSTSKRKSGSKSSPPGGPTTDSSPAARAAAQGDFGRAHALPAADVEEQHYLRASMALAERRLADVDRILAGLPAGSPRALELAWRAAHARGEAASIAAAARRLCDAGDPTGRSCADAELFGNTRDRCTVELAAPAELALSPTAPVPALAARFVGAQDGASVEVGTVLDTGASQTVVSSALAERLGIVTTTKSFPVGIAAGGGRADARLGILPELRLGSVVVRSLPVLVMDLDNLERVGVSAIVSPQQAFDGLRFALDFDRKLFTVEPADGAAPLDGGVPYYGVGFDLAVLAEVGGGPSALFGVDTGMDGAVALSRRYPRPAPATASGGAPGDADKSKSKSKNTGTNKKASLAPRIVVGGAGGQAEATQGAPVAVKIGALEIEPSGPAIIGDIPLRRPFEISGFLGNALWRGGRLVVDTRARRLVVTRSSLPPPIAPRG